jgi:pyridoxine kinase
MGDLGRGFYVKPDIPGMFKDEVITLADIITPNQFELEALTGLKTENLNDARRAIDLLHDKGPRVVLVTSYREQAPEDARGSHIDMLVSDKTGVYRIRTPELPLGAGVAGSGDLTASVFLSRYLESADVKTTLELTTGSVFGILEAAFRGGDPNPSGPRELPIVRAQQELSAPSHLFQAHKL